MVGMSTFRIRKFKIRGFWKRAISFILKSVLELSFAIPGIGGADQVISCICMLVQQENMLRQLFLRIIS